MLKRGKVNRIWDSEGWEGKYSEHDDRVRDALRGITSHHYSKNYSHTRMRDVSILDADVVMGVQSSSGSTRFNPYVRRGRNKEGAGFGGGMTAGGRGSASRRRSGRRSIPLSTHFSSKKFSESSTSWYKVTIPYGGRYTKEYILKTLLAHIAPTAFIPLKYEVRGIDSSFFVDDSEAAERLDNADRKITTIKGFRLVIKVKPELPHVELNSTLKEKIKAAMVKRYNADLKALDLSRFHTDPDLVDNYAVALLRPNVMLAVLDIIVENVPELTALDLSDNKLYALDSLNVLAAKVPNLKVLHIGRNRIRDMNQFSCLESLRVEDIVLRGNPLCDKYQDKNLYVR
ncbi:hypothetical protein B7P43_G05619 [Cryptotermes secundus]|uniref:Uncharacterized protein n=1 Tax=Cryptotermes secundus TaxID=105785 RepID=A0A2J7Q4K1_9NEOP|nr:hypothetical protein B7P43_G05619 [Cryptotermes secundus]